MRARVKLGKGEIITEIIEKRSRSSLVRLPDNHIIVRKNRQIYEFIGEVLPVTPAIPKTLKPKAGFWKKILALFRGIWYALSGA